MTSDNIAGQYKNSVIFVSLIAECHFSHFMTPKIYFVFQCKQKLKLS